MVYDAFLDTLSADAWPAPHGTTVAGWRLGYGYGVTKRANCVLPAATPADLGDAIGAVEAFYAERGQPARFKIGPTTRPARLDALLADRGYQVEDPTLVLTADVGAALDRLGGGGDLLDPPVPVPIAPAPTRDWLEVWWSIDGRGGSEELAVAEGILTSVPAGYALLDAEHPLAVGRAVVQGTWIGVYCMAVRPEARRHGLGRAVLRGLLSWGRARGANGAYLLVVETNTAARRLYEQAGFTETSWYHYRTLPTHAWV